MLEQAKMDQKVYVFQRKNIKNLKENIFQQ